MCQLLLGGTGDSRHTAWQGSFKSIIISNVPLPISQNGATTYDTHMRIHINTFAYVSSNSILDPR